MADGIKYGRAAPRPAADIVAAAGQAGPMPIAKTPHRRTSHLPTMPTGGRVREPRNFSRIPVPPKIRYVRSALESLPNYAAISPHSGHAGRLRREHLALAWELVGRLISDPARFFLRFPGDIPDYRAQIHLAQNPARPK